MRAKERSSVPVRLSARGAMAWFKMEGTFERRRAVQLPKSQLMSVGYFPWVLLLLQSTVTRLNDRDWVRIVEDETAFGRLRRASDVKVFHPYFSSILFTFGPTLLRKNTSTGIEPET